jgi:hypothetical protein
MTQDTDYTLMQRTIYEFKKLVPILVVVFLSSLLLLLDLDRPSLSWIRQLPQLILVTISLSVTAFVLGVIKIIISWLFPTLHLSAWFKKIEQKPITSVIAYVATLLFITFLIWITLYPASARAEDIVCHDKVLMKSKPYLPMISDAFGRYWPNAPYKYVEPGKLDRETACPNMKKCWTPTVQLKTSREWGIGISQVTIAYNSDGSIRFNNFEAAKKKYNEILSQWTYDDIYNPKYHILYSVLEDKSNFIRMTYLFGNDIDRWAGTLVSYNAGSGRVNNRFTLCKLTEGCDTSKWFGGLDGVASKTEIMSTIYGVSLQKRVNDYPYDVIFNRCLKYRGFI